LIAIFAPQITNWRIGDAYTKEQIQIVVELTRIMLLGQVFFAVSSFFSGMLQSYQRFVVPALVPLLYNGGIVLGTYVLFPVLGIKAAGVGVIVGAFLHMAVQWPFVKKLGWKYRWQWDFNFPMVKKLFSLMPARTLTLGMSEVQNFGLSYFVTSIPGVIAGGVAGIGYTLAVLARSLIVMPIRFVGVPIGQASLPFLADLSDEENLVRFKKVVLNYLNQIAYLACPAAVLLLILRIPAVRLVFGTRNFPWELTVMVARMVAIMAISIPMQAMFHLLLRGFHALRDTVTPFLISVFTTCAFFIGAALAVQMSENQLLGIAVTICVTGILEGLLYIVFLHFKLKKLITLNFIITQMKIVLSSGVMAVGLYLPFKLLDNFVFNTSRVVPLLALTLITAMVGLSVYIGLSKIFKIQEMEILINLFRYFKRKKKGETKLLLPPTEIINEVDENKV
jgi:putative peptidoglycan lipid II flippase